METFAKDFFHRREIRRHGEFTRAGDERWPVCRIGMTGNTSMKDFNRAMCHFYAHPPGRSGSTDELGRRALDYVLHCETRLLIIDDLHFLHWQHRGGIEINNHFKYIANDFPVTLLSIGVGLKERGLLIEDYSYDELFLAQTARRTTLLEMRPYEINTERQRRDWRNLLTTIEQRLVLGDKHRGMLAEELSDYLFIRSTGHIGSLMDLIRRGVRPSDSHGNRVSNPQVTRYHQDRQRCRAGAPRTGRRIPHPEEKPPSCNYNDTDTAVAGHPGPWRGA